MFTATSSAARRVSFALSSQIAKTGAEAPGDLYRPMFYLSMGAPEPISSAPSNPIIASLHKAMIYWNPTAKNLNLV
jgi:hypothetical protein